MKKNLVVILGWGSVKDAYEKFISLTPDEWNVILISPTELLDNSFADPIEKLGIILNDQKIEKCHILGHSLGGAIALQAALSLPNRINHLYLIDAEGVFEQIDFLKTAIAYIKTGFHNFRYEGQLFLKAMSQVIPRPWYHLKLGRYAHNQDLITAAEKIIVPTTIIWGDKDIVIPLSQGNKLHQAIKESDLIILKNEDHNWIMNHSELFWQKSGII